MGRQLDPNSKFGKVRDYKEKNPNATPKQIAKALGLPVKTVYGATYKYIAKPKKPKRANKPITFVPVPPVPTVKLVDLVNHPPHYTSGGIETIDFIEAKKLNYNLGNVVKYVTRADLKGAKKQDLEKAMWYLRREIERHTI